MSTPTDGSRRPARLTIDLLDSQIAVQAAPPSLVSQKTSGSVLGLTSRPFLDAVKAFRASGGKVIDWGRLRLVDRADFVRWLSERNAETKPDGAVALAAELGLTLVGGQ